MHIAGISVRGAVIAAGAVTFSLPQATIQDPVLVGAGDIALKRGRGLAPAR
jgi:hypothetical protein